MPGSTARTHISSIIRCFRRLAEIKNKLSWEKLNPGGVPNGGGFPLFSGKVQIVSRTLSGLFLVDALNRPSKRKGTSRKNPRTIPEKIGKILEKSGKSQKGHKRTKKEGQVQIGKPPRLNHPPLFGGPWLSLYREISVAPNRIGTTFRIVCACGNKRHVSNGTKWHCVFHTFQGEHRASAKALQHLRALFRNSQAWCGQLWLSMLLIILILIHVAIWHPCRKNSVPQEVFRAAC